tara:strand:- start:3818 stop:4324 length:507 start_codon:yes stop_codon:yes gene_type:complete
MILQTSDFDAGKFQISYDQNTVENLEVYLTADNEKALLYELMGKTEADLFIADLTGTPSIPVSAKWVDIFTFFAYEDIDIITSAQGIKEYLVGRVYNQFVSSQSVINQASGNGIIQSDATAGEGLITKGIVLYNRTIDEGQKVQYYMHLTSATYPNFKGLALEFRSPI